MTLIYDWKIWARPKQLIPVAAFVVWLILTGRGWGKTRTGAEFIKERVSQGYKRIALVGQTKADVRDTMIEVGDSSLLNISPPWDYPEYEPSKRRLTWKNGAVAIVYSGDEPDQLRGPQHDTAWVDELAKFKYPQETWDNLEMGMRLSADPKYVITTTPRPIPIIKKLIADKDTIAIRGHTKENFLNLPQKFIDRITEIYEGTRLGRQELGGEILDDNPDALWKRDVIEQLRVVKHPELLRLVVAIDPQGKKKMRENNKPSETGIIAAGLGTDGHGYILEDATINGTPDEWGKASVTLYYKLLADKIVAEVNYGGDMVEHVIRSIDENISFGTVRAMKGKSLRAEPVSALYEQGKIHHVGTFPDLEDQMCEWIPYEDNTSPDRLDAVVWAITELMIQEREPNLRWV